MQCSGDGGDGQKDRKTFREGFVTEPLFPTCQRSLKEGYPNGRDTGALKGKVNCILSLSIYCIENLLYHMSLLSLRLSVVALWRMFFTLGSLAGLYNIVP